MSDTACADNRAGQKSRAWRLLVVLAVVFFVVAGCLLMPLLGLEEDEVAFMVCLWDPASALTNLSIFHHKLPLLLVSYAGLIKTWLYAPVFRVFGYHIPSIRLPGILLAAFTIILVGQFMKRISGLPAQLVTVGLLATDAVFLSTSTLDWGPVVLQNLLLVAGLVFAERWNKKREMWLLFVMALCFGIALWDKALFVWNLSSMAVAFLAVNPRYVFGEARWRRVAVIFLGLVIGAWPLISYNVGHHNATLKENGHFTASEVGSKFNFLLGSVDGIHAVHAFFDPKYPAMDQVRRPLEGPSLQTTRWVPWNFSSWRRWVFVILVPLGFWAGGVDERRWIAFFLLSGSLAWFQCALTLEAGASIHHTVLFWPLFYGALGVSAGAALQNLGRPGRAAVLLLLGIVLVRSLVQIDDMYSDLITHSSWVEWSNADSTLVDYLKGTGTKQVITTDWGIQNVITVRTRRAILVRAEEFDLRGGVFPDDAFRACGAPECVVVGHPPAREVFEGIDQKFSSSLERNSLKRELAQVIPDSHGTPSFYVYRIGRLQ